MTLLEADLSCVTSLGIKSSRGVALEGCNDLEKV